MPLLENASNIQHVAVGFMIEIFKFLPYKSHLQMHKIGRLSVIWYF